MDWDLGGLFGMGDTAVGGGFLDQIGNNWSNMGSDAYSGLFGQAGGAMPEWNTETMMNSAENGGGTYENWTLANADQVNGSQGLFGNSMDFLTGKQGKNLWDMGTSAGKMYMGNKQANKMNSYMDSQNDRANMTMAMQTDQNNRNKAQDERHRQIRY